MLISIMSISATRWGAALQGARMPLVEESGNWRRRQASVLLPSGGHLETGMSGFGLLPAMCATGAPAIPGVPAAAGSAGVVGAKGVLSAQSAVLAQNAAAAEGPATARKQVTYGLPADNSKRNVQMTTRVNAGGGGAPGPEPEREQALQKRPGQIPFRPRTHTGSAA